MVNKNKFFTFIKVKRTKILLTLCLIFLLLVAMSESKWKYESAFSTFIEVLGLVFIVSFIIGRSWSILYIGNKKNASLVTQGPYTMTRNPLYFFSLVGVIGMGLLTKSLLYTAGMGILMYAYLSYIIRCEETDLQRLFPEDYHGYKTKVPRLFPALLKYTETKEVTFSPKALKKTFRESLFILLFVPYLQIVEWAQENDVLPVLISLY